MQIEQHLNMTPETLKKLEEIYGASTVYDGYRALFDSMEEITDITPVRQIAKETRRRTTVSLHEPGEIVTMSDGRQYQVDDDGKWIRIIPK